MTRTPTRHARRSKKTRTHNYCPQRIKISDLRTKPTVFPPRVIYVTNPFYEQMEYGEKTVEARPNYPSLQDVVPGTLVEFKNRSSGCSFLARITSRRVHHDFATMLRKETIKACLPDHDPEDLQRAVNTYHSFRHDTYKFIARKHGGWCRSVSPYVLPKTNCRNKIIPKDVGDTTKTHYVLYSITLNVSGLTGSIIKKTMTQIVLLGLLAVKSKNIQSNYFFRLSHSMREYCKKNH